MLRDEDFSDLSTAETVVANAALRMSDSLEHLRALWATSQSDLERREILFSVCGLAVRAAILSLGHQVSSRSVVSAVSQG